MADRSDKFTERARRVLNNAQEETHRFNRRYIGTEHILLSLVQERDSVAAQVLNNLGVELSKIRSSIEFLIGRADRTVLWQIGLTPHAKKVIELAVEEARRMEHSYIGTEHILIGLIREGEGLAAVVLESLGVRLESVRAATLRVLGENHGQTVQKSLSEMSEGELSEEVERLKDEWQKKNEESLTAFRAFQDANDILRTLKKAPPQQNNPEQNDWNPEPTEPT